MPPSPAFVVWPTMMTIPEIGSNSAAAAYVHGKSNCPPCCHCVHAGSSGSAATARIDASYWWQYPENPSVLSRSSRPAPQSSTTTLWS